MRKQPRFRTTLVKSAFIGLVAVAATGAAADDVWTLADSPIVFTADYTIPAGVTVTVEPGVVIDLQQGARLFVEGSLVGSGTTFQQISIVGGSVQFTYVEVSGTLDLSHASVDVQIRPGTNGFVRFADTTFQAAAWVMNAGVGYVLSLERCVFDGAYLWVGGGTIRLNDTDFLGSFVDVSNSLLRIDGVTSTGAPFAGISLHDFEQPVYVDDLLVSGASGPGVDIIAGNFFFGSNVQLMGNEYPVQLGGAGVLPGSVLPASGNTNNLIKVEFASNGVWSMVWADPGIPYAMMGGQYHTGTLEILPGVTVLLEPNFTVWDDDSIVDARGTPELPVRFAPLVPGQSWQGLQYFHRFENCIIEGGQVGARFHSATYAGYIDNCIIRDNDHGMQNDAIVRKTRFHDNTIGAWSNNYPASLGSATNPNSFVGNGLAVDYVDSLIDARFSWWGDPSGPNSPANPGGTGDPADSGVAVIPFLTAEPDYTDNPPILNLLASPRRENAGMQYSSFVDPGTPVIVAWVAEDDVAIASQRVEFYHGWEGSWTTLAELPGTQRSYEWIVPDVNLVSNSSTHRLRVTAIDSAGQEGWDEHRYFIPTGDEPGTLTVTGMPPGPFLPGQPVGPFCVEASGTDPYAMIKAELSFDGDRWHIPLGGGIVSDCFVLSPPAPFASSDTARIRVNTSSGQNRVNYFFSDYFTVRPDPRLGDEAPSVIVTSPVGGEIFPGGGIVPIHWTATDDEGVRAIDIQVSTDGGRTWHFVAESLAPGTTAFDWQLPPSAGIEDVRVRVMASDLHFQTTTDGASSVFSISAGSSSCTDSPGEVGGVTADANATTFHWAPLPAATLYDVARGMLGELETGEPATCVASGQAEAFHDDVETPLPGAGFYYLIRGTNACGAGPWGDEGTSQTRAASCP